MKKTRHFFGQNPLIFAGKTSRRPRRLHRAIDARHSRLQRHLVSEEQRFGEAAAEFGGWHRARRPKRKTMGKLWVSWDL